MSKTKDTTTVGVSDRTPGKHTALNAVIGKINGSAVNLKVRPSTHTILDLTAGDGQPNTHSGTSSPQIVLKHMKWPGLPGRPAVPITAYFCERSPAAVDKLSCLLANEPNAHIHAGDAKDIQLPSFAGGILTVINDPNSIRDWALPPTLKDRAPKLTTIFSTLGCNVGGLKRLPLEERTGWYDCVKDQVSFLQDWHDAYLVTLEGDAAQWAYLVNWPEVWAPYLEEAFFAAFKKHTKYTVDGAWLKAGPQKFIGKLDELFLTKKELEAAA